MLTSVAAGTSTSKRLSVDANDCPATERLVMGEAPLVTNPETLTTSPSRIARAICTVTGSPRVSVSSLVLPAALVAIMVTVGFADGNDASK